MRDMWEQRPDDGFPYTSADYCGEKKPLQTCIMYFNFRLCKNCAKKPLRELEQDRKNPNLIRSGKEEYGPFPMRERGQPGRNY